MRWALAILIAIPLLLLINAVLTPMGYVSKETSGIVNAVGSSLTSLLAAGIVIARNSEAQELKAIA